MKTIIPIILSGGTGTRLWPLSTEDKPKQFWNLTGQQSLLQETCLRLKDREGLQQPIIVAGERYQSMIDEQLAQIHLPAPFLILEPFGKNTAPAITIASFFAMEKEKDPILLILPADHVISNEDHFFEAITLAAHYAHTGYLITFGIIPSSPETGYGYIQAGEALLENKLYHVNRFVEKPDSQKAEDYYRSGQYYWNSGMFMFKASVYLEEIQRFRPDIFSISQETYIRSERTPSQCVLEPTSFSQCPKDSIDYAVMEKTHRALVFPVDIGWSDVGSWSSLFEVSQKDSEGNVILGDVAVSQSKNSYLRATHRHLAVIGVSDLVVVETEDAVFIAHKDHCQEIKSLLRKKES